MGMRRVALLLALLLAVPAVGSVMGGGDAQRVRPDERRLDDAKIKHDGDSLLEFLRRHSLTDPEREEMQIIISKLADKAFRVREQAQAQLVSRGPVLLDLLRERINNENTDLELKRRASQCIDRIKEKDYTSEVYAAAVRLLAQRKPAGALEALLLYVPFAANETVAEEVRNGLAALGVRDGRAEKALSDALADRHATRRSAAGEVLARTKVKDHEAAVARLLKDPEPAVRLRVAIALAATEKREAVQELIDLLEPLPRHLAWQAEDVLHRLAQDHEPPRVSLGFDAASRKKCRDAWDAWWRAHQDQVNLAKLREAPRLLGHTVLVLLDENRILEVDGDGKMLWQINDVMFPLDVQYLPNDRLLVAEYNAGQVTERDLRGQIQWRHPVSTPIVAQRLPDGNTFIASDTGLLLEVDRDGKETFKRLLGAQEVMKAMKLLNGDIVCLMRDARVVRLNARGEEISGFTVSLGQRLYGGRIHMLPNGSVLVPHHAENKVIEYDATGKTLWEVAIEQPIMATRLPNGNTLVTSMAQNRAVEFDRDGNEVWQFRANTRVTRAVRR